MLARLAAVLVTAVLLVIAPVQARAGWERVSETQSSLMRSDGVRYLAAQLDERRILVVDTVGAGATSGVAIPSECTAAGYAWLRAVGGGQLAVGCSEPRPGATYVERPLLLDLATRTWHEVVGVDAWLAQAEAGGGGDRGFSVGAVGARWLELIVRSREGSRRWIDWRTGELRPARPTLEGVEDPNRPELTAPLCDPVRWERLDVPHLYVPPYAVDQTGGEVLLLRCGSRRSLSLSKDLWDQPLLGGGLVTWHTATGRRQPRPHVFLPDCQVRLTWPRALRLVHAGRTLLLHAPDFRNSSPAMLRRLRLPDGCPPGAASHALRLRSATGVATPVWSAVAGWPTSRAWGGGRAAIVPGTFAPAMIAIERGERLRVGIDVGAAGIRSRRGDGRWRRARPLDIARRRWQLRPAARGEHGRVEIVVRYLDGGRARYVAKVR